MTDTTFWRAVAECLYAFHNMSGSTARMLAEMCRAAAYREGRTVAGDPFAVANGLAGREEHLDEHLPTYLSILEGLR